MDNIRAEAREKKRIHLEADVMTTRLEHKKPHNDVHS